MVAPRVDAPYDCGVDAGRPVPAPSFPHGASFQTHGARRSCAMAATKETGIGYESHFPNSTKVHVDGALPGVRVPFREVAVGAADAGERCLWMYDTSGPWTDPTARLDVREGLPALRASWIDGRGDTEAGTLEQGASAGGFPGLARKRRRAARGA